MEPGEEPSENAHRAKRVAAKRRIQRVWGSKDVIAAAGISVRRYMLDW